MTSTTWNIPADWEQVTQKDGESCGFGPYDRDDVGLWITILPMSVDTDRLVEDLPKLMEQALKKAEAANLRPDPSAEALWPDGRHGQGRAGGPLLDRGRRRRGAVRQQPGADGRAGSVEPALCEADGQPDDHPRRRAVPAQGGRRSDHPAPREVTPSRTSSSTTRARFAARTRPSTWATSSARSGASPKKQRQHPQALRRKPGHPGRHQHGLRGMGGDLHLHRPRPQAQGIHRRRDADPAPAHQRMADRGDHHATSSRARRCTASSPAGTCAAGGSRKPCCTSRPSTT